jgi:deazaflavin-dependent oxidoreductase (nitroreductase family)
MNERSQIVTAAQVQPQADSRITPAPQKPRFGGVLWRLARLTSPLTMPMAGKRWNPIFAVIEHRGRKSGRRYLTPVAARRTPRGFVISLAFGSQVDWYRNLQAAGEAIVHWKGADYPVTAPQAIDASAALSAFNPVQRFALRLGGVDGYIRVADAGSDAA